jgi:NRPS condensation-like uncharacterized protein
MAVHHSDIPAAPLDLVPLALKSVSNQKLTLVIRIAGRIDDDRMRQALKLLRTYCPIVGYRLCTDNGWPKWRRVGDRGALTPLVVTATEDDLQEHQSLNGYHSCAAAADATVSVRILRGLHDDTLYISVDHTIADAAGAKEIVYTLASYYARLAYHIRPRILQPAASPRGLKEIRAHIPGFKKFTAVCGWRPTRGHWKFPDQNKNHRCDSGYAIQHLGEHSITDLKKYGSRDDATVNDILITAFFGALHDLHGIAPGKRMPVQFTIDLRRFLRHEPRCEIANLSSSSHVWLHKHAANPFGQNLRETHLALTRIKRKTPGIGSALVLELILKLGFTRARRKLEEVFNTSRVTGTANPIFINTGVIDAHRLNFGSVEVRNACMLGPSLLVPGVAMTASGFRDRLTLNVGYGYSNSHNSYVTKLLDSTIGLLSVPHRSQHSRQH